MYESPATWKCLACRCPRAPGESSTKNIRVPIHVPIFLLSQRANDLTFEALLRPAEGDLTPQPSALAPSQGGAPAAAAPRRCPPSRATCPVPRATKEASDRDSAGRRERLTRCRRFNSDKMGEKPKQSELFPTKIKLFRDTRHHPG